MFLKVFEADICPERHRDAYEILLVKNREANIIETPAHGENGGVKKRRPFTLRLSHPHYFGIRLGHVGIHERRDSEGFAGVAFQENLRR